MPSIFESEEIELSTARLFVRHCNDSTIPCLTGDKLLAANTCGYIVTCDISNAIKHHILLLLICSLNINELRCLKLNPKLLMFI
ncbi:Hypothetical predicted protein [Octopus vulgaris]|uniref:Uncharacterized protein n=1 Tax=Octopus vulgaris TaxID=6645 RepID=A0AA36BLK2_OCTVU|nr:Hypothetical predicted protein [Octopus vulgaris]